VQCAESLRVQAYFDGEVDAIGAVDVERHLEECAGCRALLQQLERARTAVRTNLPLSRAPGDLDARIVRALHREIADKTTGEIERRRAGPITSQPGGQLADQVGGQLTDEVTRHRRQARPVWRIPTFWTGALGGAGAACLLAILAFFLLLPSLGPNPFLDDLVAAHVRSLMPEHLIDVVSTDRHTVKPWFSGHADVSPAVADFAAQGYRLVGGRADYLYHQRSAVVVYQHGQHVINIFAWAAGESTLPAHATRDGYHLASWKSGDLQYCAVSDTEWSELLALVQLLKESDRRETREGDSR
jgi:anti-sigma factor RsiW